MRGMQCKVEFEYELSISYKTDENHGKTLSSLPVAGPYRCVQTSSQQSAI
jgi:hypothetical protein